MKSTRAGFTLLESVIAIALASAGLAALYQVYASSARAELLANDAEDAASLAQQLMATARPGDRGEAGSFLWQVDAAATPGWDGLETVTIVLATETGREYRVSWDRPVTAGEPR
jgi:prepilin-type N-terminal cleavage/methylation domain-containing protein